MLLPNLKQFNYYLYLIWIKSLVFFYAPCIIPSYYIDYYLFTENFTSKTTPKPGLKHKHQNKGMQQNVQISRNKIQTQNYAKTKDISREKFPFVFDVLFDVLNLLYKPKVFREISNRVKCG